MDRKYPLESLILSRSYDNSTKINELLEQRYAINDKPTILLRPTEGERETQKTLLTQIRNTKIQYQKEKKKDQTKVVFKKYITKSIRFQKKLKFKAQKSESVKDVTKFKEYKKIAHFEEFLTLNELWIGYIQDLLQIDTEKKTYPNISQILTKLSSADYNGCFIRVLESKNKKIIGKHGIVIYDSKNFFLIVEPRDEKDPTSIGGLKMLEKKGTKFSFVVPLYDLGNDDEDVDVMDDYYLEFSIIGSRFQFRAPDRSGKKFKSRNVDDL